MAELVTRSSKRRRVAAEALSSRHRAILRLIWDHGALARSTLHERTALRPTTIGELTRDLITGGLLRPTRAEPSAGGRPSVPLEIDPVRRHVVGVSLAPGKVEATRVNLCGGVIGASRVREIAPPDLVVRTAASLVRALIGPDTLAVGVAATGFIDPPTRSLRLSSALGGGPRTASLAPIDRAASERRVPVLLDNDMHALSARWLLTHRAEVNDDVLLVSIDDGAIGASLLIDGRPNRGCAIAANEFGHVRFFVDTPKCYCGHRGCLERIVSSAFLRDGDGCEVVDLSEAVRAFDRESGARESVTRRLQTVRSHLAMALANAVNFVRPSRLVLVSPLLRHAPFANALLGDVRELLLSELTARVRIDVWEQPSPRSAENAAWLALADLYDGRRFAEGKGHD